MRRMIPQKFSDWIKSLKDKLFVNNDGDVEVDGELVVDGTDTSTKKIYCHPVYLSKSGAQYALLVQLLSESSEAITSIGDLFDIIVASTGKRLTAGGVFNGKTVFIIFAASATSIEIVYIDTDLPSGRTSVTLTKAQMTSTFEGIIDNPYAIN